MYDAVLSETVAGYNAVMPNLILGWFGRYLAA